MHQSAPISLDNQGCDSAFRFQAPGLIGLRINRNFTFQGKLLMQNIKKGVILNSEGRNLVIQKVGREAKGDYKCRAGNNVPTVGAMRESQLFHLDVKCKSVLRWTCLQLVN